MKEKLVVIGNGMSGLRVLEDLFDITTDKYDITIFGEEPHLNYNRIMLSYLLSEIGRASCRERVYAPV